MTDKQQLKRVIRDFDREKNQGSDLDRWARFYGRRVMMRTFSKRDAKNAEEGFMIGFLFARELEGY